MNSMRKPGKTVKGFSRFFRYLDNGFSLSLIRYNIFRKLKKEQKDRHAQRTLVE